MKVSDQAKQLMKTLHEIGVTQEEIAAFFNVTDSTVGYWVNDEYRERRKGELRKQMKEKYDKGIHPQQLNVERQRTYMRNYMRNRYQNDPEFREKVKRANRKGGRFKE